MPEDMEDRLEELMNEVERLRVIAETNLRLIASLAAGRDIAGDVADALAEAEISIDDD